MGLIKNIRMPDGLILGYHKIRQLNIEVNAMNTLYIVSYLNKEERDMESEDFVPYRETWFIEHEYDPSMSVNTAYEYIKTLAEFDGATDVIDPWAVGMAYYTDDLVMDGEDVYKCIQPHTSQEGWEPHSMPSLWKKTAKPGEIPEWVQPTGAQDAFMKGDLCTHNGKTWRSTLDNNVWEPGVYGWDEVQADD